MSMLSKIVFSLCNIFQYFFYCQAKYVVDYLIMLSIGISRTLKVVYITRDSLKGYNMLK